MLISWQSHQEYKTFLHEAKIYFDNSQRTWLCTELAAAREKLQLLNLDPVMVYLELLYPPCIRTPALSEKDSAAAILKIPVRTTDCACATIPTRMRTEAGIRTWMIIFSAIPFTRLPATAQMHR